MFPHFLRRVSLTTWVLLFFTGAAFVAICLTTFERPPVRTAQIGYRGVAMEQLQNPRLLPALVAANQVPAAPEPADTEGDRASQVFENVQVLGNLSVAQFGRIMQAMTEWVSPTQGCNYCHNPENMASDEVYTKVVTRRMLQMTHTINTTFATHVRETGVTCYTCHRGHPVPQYVWATRPNVRGGVQADRGQNHPSPAANLSTLPIDPFTPYFLEENHARVIGRTPAPGHNPNGIMETEWVYSLMTHMSQSLNVNCTFCHNSRAFSRWEESPPQRVNSWHGIQMTRATNREYIQPLAPLWQANPRGPAEYQSAHVRLGPLGDPMKVNCTTCHQGANRPLLGAQMLRDYPELTLVTQNPIEIPGVTPPRTAAAAR